MFMGLLSGVSLEEGQEKSGGMIKYLPFTLRIHVLGTDPFGNIQWNYTIALTQRWPYYDRKKKSELSGRGQTWGTKRVRRVIRRNRMAVHPRYNRSTEAGIGPSEITPGQHNDRQTKFSRCREDGVQVEEGAERLEKMLVPTMMHLMVDEQRGSTQTQSNRIRENCSRDRHGVGRGRERCNLSRWSWRGAVKIELVNGISAVNLQDLQESREGNEVSAAAIAVHRWKLYKDDDKL
ncbi:uncharacterized protein EV420DRAFT_1752888 [Desarmillaria tabescens]|uniref:Uncharacterized protein n=1 Tax=Armillaria tabescens TaxID=1929756 RepID=A0AA39JCJ4_ARMTA|nr:uncharacterized protein EV420DRAFT_1752888 [Desarmillaria tabescens]KAK0439485.1 hypothetical protein EV420DRAFT_1752888 [Desarmillaria tabescens]